MSRQISIKTGMAVVVLALAVSVGHAREDRPSAAVNVAQWATIKAADGPAGRPLPLAGNWMAEGIFGPQRFVELIESGHHVLPTFLGVNSQFMRAYIAGQKMHRDRLDARFEDYYRPGLEYARKHRLPIAIREWNWSGMPQAHQRFVAEAEGREVSPDEDVRLIVNGQPDANKIDPFGPVDAWWAWGEFWTGNDMMRRIQEAYPDPPMVIFLNNNEGARAGSGDIRDDYPRYLKFVEEQMTERQGESAQQRKNRAIREAWTQRYGAMYEAVRDAMVAPAWKENVRFVAYNTLWDTGYIGQGDRPRPGGLGSTAKRVGCTGVGTTAACRSCTTTTGSPARPTTGSGACSTRR